MRVPHATDPVVERGRSTFATFAATCVCGAGTGAYLASLERERGPDLVPGAVLACVDRDIVERHHAVARACDCPWDVVAEIVDGMEGVEPQCLWKVRGGFVSANLENPNL